MARNMLEMGLLRVSAVLLLLSPFFFVHVDSSGLSSRSFQGFHNLQEIQCSGDNLPQGSDLMSMILYDFKSNTILAAANVGKHECYTSGVYVACHLDKMESRKSAVKALVDDLAEGQSRGYGCNVTIFASGMRTQSYSWSITVHHIRTTTPSPPSTTTPTTTTIRPQLPNNGKAPVASGVMGNVQEFQLPISVIIIGLVLLLFFAILCAILVILQCRGRRRRRSRAANRESLLSQKSEPVDQGGYRTTRSMVGYPPGHMPPETPASNFAMRYQKSIPDTGYVSGSSVYYSEPYGTLDDEIKERLRPNPRMCHIPYDLKGNVLETHPQEHSA